MLITSLTNPRVKQVVALRDKKSEREESGLMLVEGFEELSLALECGVRPRTLFYCPEIFPQRQRYPAQSTSRCDGCGVN